MHRLRPERRFAVPVLEFADHLVERDGNGPGEKRFVEAVGADVPVHGDAGPLAQVVVADPVVGDAARRRPPGKDGFAERVGVPGQERRQRRVVERDGNEPGGRRRRLDPHLAPRRADPVLGLQIDGHVPGELLRAPVPAHADLRLEVVPVVLLRPAAQVRRVEVEAVDPVLRMIAVRQQPRVQQRRDERLRAGVAGELALVGEALLPRGEEESGGKGEFQC